MPEKAEALSILFVLLPGFLAAYIVQQLAVRKAQTEFDKVIESLILAVFVYIAGLPICHYRLPVSWETVSGAATVSVHWLDVVWLTGLAIALGLLYSANLNHDWVLKFMRWIGLTERTSRSTIWNDVFQDIPRSYLAAGLADGRSVLGYLRYYSDDPEEASLFLEDAAWVTEEGQNPILGPGILLTKESKVQFVMFLDAASEQEPE